MDGARVAAVSYRKMRALLAYLGMEQDRDCAREALADLLWSGVDAETARGNLRRTLADLRRALETPCGQVLFSADKQSIRLNPGLQVDARNFERAAAASLAAAAPPATEAAIRRMERAAGLYRGEFMADFALPDCPDFESWRRGKAEDLRRVVLALLGAIASHYERSHEYAKALRFASQQADLDPWNEGVLRQVMRLEAASGQLQAALARYDAFTRSLERELHAPPGDETRQLARSLLVAAPAAVAPIMVRSAPPPPARRQVTVLACEVLLPAGQEPDEAMPGLQARESRCLEVVRKLSGHVVRPHGGALLAYFGFPHADERAPFHAVQAALAMARDAAGGPAVRVGVHTGVVVSGADPSVPDATGGTSREAVEVSRCAAGHEVVLSPATHGLVSGYFDCAAAGPVFKVIAQTAARTRLDAVAALTPLAGRRGEIAQLLRLWERAAAGQRQVVLVVGDPGIGKSRLLHALKERLSPVPHAVCELPCFLEHSHSPFQPLIEMLQALCGFGREDSEQEKSRKLAGYLQAQVPAAAGEAMALLAQLLSLPLPGAFPACAYSPQKQKEQTVAVLLGLLQALAAQQPLLLVVEDLHWVDPSTLEFLARFVEQREPARVLAVFTARPEFDPPWQASHEVSLAMAPLADTEVQAMVASMGREIPEETLRRIVERADGVPLFVEEMVKMPALAATAAAAEDVPATLQGLLAMRLDSLGEARTTAQLAAIIGREFDLELLRRLHPDPAALKASLRALQDADLIHRVDDHTRKFKHALIQEAAYQSQARAARQAAHRRIAQVLLAEFPQVAAHRPESIARHLSAAGDAQAAITYWLKAGQRAAMNSANAEAREHLDRGLRLLPALPAGDERDALEATLQLNLGTLLVATKGYGSDEAGEAYARALSLCERQGAASGRFDALWGMWLTSSSRVGHGHSLELAARLLGQAEQAGDVLQLQVAHHARGNSSLMTGDPAAARQHLERAIALYRPSQHDELVRRFGENVCVSSHALRALALWQLGLPRQADTATRRAVALARQVQHPNSLGYALCAGAVLHHWRGRVDVAFQVTQEAMALGERHGLPFWQTFGAAYHGWAQARRGQAEGVALIRHCLAGVNAVMSGAVMLFLAPLCDALVHLRQWDEAEERIQEALQAMDRIQDRLFEREIRSLQAACLAGRKAANDRRTLPA
ncbi:MAG TPA: AAA family ATPase [Ramlibacter sp.]|nr:AAA family ATPase [Ramlibacter sp.]